MSRTIPPLNIVKGEPLVLPDGTKVVKDEDGKTIIQTKRDQEIVATMDEILTDVYEDDQIETYERTLADVTVTRQEFNPVMLILSYSMWGLDEASIARFLEIDEQQIIDIKNSDLFVRTRKELLEAIRYAEASSIHGYLSSQAKKAAIQVVKHMSSPSGDLSLAASKDILDRAGFRPADKVEHSHKFDDELRIVHLQQAKPVDLDTGL